MNLFPARRMICTTWQMCRKFLSFVKLIDKTVTIYGQHVKNLRKKALSPCKHQMSLNVVISNDLNHCHSLIHCLLIFKSLFSTHPQPKLVLVIQSCPTLHNHMDCSPLGSSVHEILQTSILEWVAFPFSRGSSQPRDQSQVSCTAGRFFTT